VTAPPEATPPPAEKTQAEPGTAPVSRKSHRSKSVPESASGDEPVASKKDGPCTSFEGFRCTDIPDLVSKADAAAGRGDYSEATYDYNIVLHMDPKNSAAHAGLHKVEEARQMQR
jgi:hypothetical protein